MRRISVPLNLNDHGFDHAGDGDQVADTKPVSDRIAKRWRQSWDHGWYLYPNDIALRLIRIEPPKTDWLMIEAYSGQQLYAVSAAVYKLVSHK